MKNIAIIPALGGSKGIPLILICDYNQSFICRHKTTND